MPGTRLRLPILKTTARRLRSAFCAVLLVAGILSAPAAVPLAEETFDEVWRIMHTRHFDTNFAGLDWVQVGKDYRPKALAAKNVDEFRKVVQQMLDLLRVSHLAIISSDLASELDARNQPPDALGQAEAEESGTTGLTVRWVGRQLVVTAVEPGTAAALAGIRTGWEISAIDDLSSERLWTRVPETLQEPRRSFLLWRQASQHLIGAPGSKVTLRLRTPSGAKELELKRGVASGEPIQFGSLPTLYAKLDSHRVESGGRSIGVIQFNIWMLPTAIAFNRAVDRLRDCAGIVVDLRGNVGGMVGMLIGISGHFLKTPEPLGTLVLRDNELRIAANPRFGNDANQRVEPFAGPLAILVDEVTASASEIFAGRLQEMGRARIFGKRTSGQAVPAIFDDLPNGDILYHPFGDFVTPKGKRFEGVGVVPEEAAELRVEALLNDKDEALDKALQWIKAQPPAK